MLCGSESCADTQSKPYEVFLRKLLIDCSEEDLLPAQLLRDDFLGSSSVDTSIAIEGLPRYVLLAAESFPQVLEHEIRCNRPNSSIHDWLLYREITKQMCFEYQLLVLMRACLAHSESYKIWRHLLNLLSRFSTGHEHLKCAFEVMHTYFKSIGFRMPYLLQLSPQYLIKTAASPTRIRNEYDSLFIILPPSQHATWVWSSYFTYARTLESKQLLMNLHLRFSQLCSFKLDEFIKECYDLFITGKFELSGVIRQRVYEFLLKQKTSVKQTEFIHYLELLCKFSTDNIEEIAEYGLRKYRAIGFQIKQFLIRVVSNFPNYRCLFLDYQLRQCSDLSEFDALLSLVSAEKDSESSQWFSNTYLREDELNLRYRYEYTLKLTLYDPVIMKNYIYAKLQIADDSEVADLDQAKLDEFILLFENALQRVKRNNWRSYLVLLTEYFVLLAQNGHSELAIDRIDELINTNTQEFNFLAFLTRLKAEILLFIGKEDDVISLITNFCKQYTSKNCSYRNAQQVMALLFDLYFNQKNFKEFLFQLEFFLKHKLLEANGVLIQIKRLVKHISDDDFLRILSIYVDMYGEQVKDEDRLYYMRCLCSRYGSTKVELIRESFERVINECSSLNKLSFIYLYALYEVEFGLTAFALAALNQEYPDLNKRSKALQSVLLIYFTVKYNINNIADRNLVNRIESGAGLYWPVLVSVIAQGLELINAKRNVRQLYENAGSTALRFLQSENWKKLKDYEQTQFMAYYSGIFRHWGRFAKELNESSALLEYLKCDSLFKKQCAV